MQNLKLIRAAAVVAGLMMAGRAGHAAIITMDNTNGTGESWLTASDWSNDQVPSPEHDYVVDGSVTAFQVRTPGTAAEFGGATLTLQNGGALALGGTGSTVATIFVKDGGYITNAGINTSRELHGQTITFTGSTPSYTNYIRTAGTNSGNVRGLTFNAQILGGGTLRLAQHGTITFANAGNNFTGTMISGGSGLTIPGVAGTVTHSASNFTTVSAASLGSSASYTVDTFSSLELNFDWTTSGHLTLIRGDAQTDAQAPMILHQDIRVGHLTIGGTTLEAGTYDFATLNSTYDLFFKDGGSGSITAVFPEPASASVLLAGAGFALQRRRRKLPR